MGAQIGGGVFMSPGKGKKGRDFATYPGGEGETPPTLD